VDTRLAIRPVPMTDFPWVPVGMSIFATTSSAKCFNYILNLFGRSLQIWKIFVKIKHLT
jgi:hypothetical protein